MWTRREWIAFTPLALAAAKGAPVQSMEIVSLKKIWDQGAHNAFTDLIRFRNHWYCTFREAEDHVGGDGQLRVIESKDGDTWTSSALLTEAGVDLRDPKLSITPDNRLMIVAGGSVHGGTKVLKSRQPRVAFSKDAKAWTKPAPVLGTGDWLWRVTWHKKRAYGVSYYIGPQGRAAGDWELRFCESANGSDWQATHKLAVTGQPNETTLRFLDNGECVAFARREAEDKQAWIGRSLPPYRDWKWTPCGHQTGGPNFIILPDGRWVGGGRRYFPDRKHKTEVGALTESGYQPLVSLPSAGDNSYPGFVWHDNLLWMSYYSSHEGKTSIYLAKLKLS
ncbi:MAG: exo-alpha-sialidase [Bryobacterales bacterium]|nr:exo-alpha-sialidase [Bryobacterales bacterium]